MKQTVISITTDGELGVVVINEEGREPRTFQIGNVRAEMLVLSTKTSCVMSQEYYREEQEKKAEAAK